MVANKEWTNPYNPMNSMKGLAFFEHYKKIIGWHKGKNELPAPLVTIAPSIPKRTPVLVISAKRGFKVASLPPPAEAPNPPI